MNQLVRNILAVVTGWIAGSAVNMSLVQIGIVVLPVPGIDPNDMVALKAAMPTLTYEFFIFPFLAHSLGTLVGALVAGLIAANRKMTFALAIGGLFLIGGIAINMMLAGPIWFTILDIAVAYIPMAWIGGTFALSLSKSKS